MRRLLSLTPLLLLVGALATACGSSSKSTTPPTTSTSGGTTTTTTTTTATTPNGPSGLQAEANAAATGDIPDNQAFLTFHNTAARYSMKYPEGWAQQGGGNAVTFRDKNNIVRIVVSNGGAPTAAGIRQELGALRGAQIKSGPASLTISGAPAFKVVYTTQSAANAVTGKRVTLTVDRYYLSHGGKRAIVDLGTPVGVDNVDAYRMMIQSFRWR